ncbi:MULTISPECIES: DNA sulfur modification protein DndE [Kordiimonas]|jgi:DNA sulfur modification protein DndE|uniref:DNA sulfur modification protein DndE n=1 Tax=Kordiimonas TaxID=288021 RepID=UPI00257A924F|nr:DNA sulfur modification protein DndE [Kordiimonas sp. UBA4487]
MSLNHIRLSQKEKDQLITIKRTTGIENWNILCRWAFCLSLREDSIPPDQNLPSDSNVEMDWSTFGGQYKDIYFAALKERCIRDGKNLDEETLSQQFRLHLRRGIGYLFGDKEARSLTGMVDQALATLSE